MPPRVRTIEVDSLGGTGDFELLAISRALPAVVTRRGTSRISAEGWPAVTKQLTSFYTREDLKELGIE